MAVDDQGPDYTTPSIDDVVPGASVSGYAGIPPAENGTFSLGPADTPDYSVPDWAERRESWLTGYAPGDVTDSDND